jgi:hypothetical protein
VSIPLFGPIPAHRRKLYLRIVLFPWLIWDLCRLPFARLRRTRLFSRGLGRLVAGAAQGTLFLAVGVPLIVLLLGEVLITLNRYTLGEQADFRLQNDFAAGYSDLNAVLTIGGPPTPAPAPPRPGDEEDYFRFLVERYAPVILHKVADHPQWDIPLFIDFDGNEDPRDNLENEPRFRPHHAGVYGEVTAITTDSIYLTYSLYHVKDYDHPVREALSRWTYHDNDNEGFHMRVDRRDGRVVEIETWFHNRFLLFNHTGVSTGTEPVHGRIHLEGGTHPLIYAQPQGHGVRCAQLVDLPSLEKNLKVLRFRGDRPPVPTEANRRNQLDATYDLKNFDRWYELARGPLGTQGEGEGMFEEKIPLGTLPDGEELFIGRFIAGRDYMVGGWSRPKPMWSWDDGWDEVPIFFWHFLPHYSFVSHGGSQLSGDYLYNRPFAKTFDRPMSELAPFLRAEAARRGGEKWQEFEQIHAGEIPRRAYWYVFQQKVRGYVNYLFHALG